mmetsp:Transcript_3894/g.9668  ORF Transcript_3894/g.9668 Transcript_3894/m.9668 type:complete len:208 (-) Transcript_3894:1421-2044(-)
MKCAASIGLRIMRHSRGVGKSSLLLHHFGAIPAKESWAWRRASAARAFFSAATSRRIFARATASRTSSARTSRSTTGFCASTAGASSRSSRAATTPTKWRTSAPSSSLRKSPSTPRRTSLWSCSPTGCSGATSPRCCPSTLSSTAKHMPRSSSHTTGRSWNGSRRGYSGSGTSSSPRFPTSRARRRAAAARTSPSGSGRTCWGACSG